MSKDMLILPQIAGNPEVGLPCNKLEVAWPFTKLGKSLDTKLNDKGLTLKSKDFSADSPGGPGLIILTRQYVSCCHKKVFYSGDNYDKEVSYVRVLNTPEKGELCGGKGKIIEYGDFEAKEITWFNDQFMGYIPTTILINKLKESKFGHEEIDIHIEKNIDVKFNMAHGHTNIETFLSDSKAGTYMLPVFGRKLKKKDRFSIDIDNVKIIQMIDKILDYTPLIN